VSWRTDFLEVEGMAMGFDPVEEGGFCSGADGDFSCVEDSFPTVEAASSAAEASFPVSESSSVSPEAHFPFAEAVCLVVEASCPVVEAGFFDPEAGCSGAEEDEGGCCESDGGLFLGEDGGS